MNPDTSPDSSSEELKEWKIIATCTSCGGTFSQTSGINTQAMAITNVVQNLIYGHGYGLGDDHTTCPNGGGKTASSYTIVSTQ